MPLILPNLDDRTFDQLVREALDMVPSHAPEWTDHNASEPGITLIELLAYVTEILIYRVNQIGDKQLAAFVTLLTGKEVASGVPVAEQLRDAVRRLRLPGRAVNPEDFERLSLALDPDVSLERDPEIKRAHCVPGFNLSATDGIEQPDHISIVIVPTPAAGERFPQPDKALLQRVRRKLEKYRIITARLHVVRPRYVPVRVNIGLVLTGDVPDAQVQKDVTRAVADYFDPLGIPTEDDAWPFGRGVYLSEIYDTLERLAGVDYVASLDMTSDEPDRMKRNARGEVVAIELHEHELPHVRIGHLQTRSPLSTLEGQI